MAEQEWNVSLDGCQVTLNYGGHDYIINVDQEEAERLRNVAVYASDYSRMVVAQVGRTELGLPCDAVMPLVTESPANMCSQEIPSPVAVTPPTATTTATQHTTASEFKWTHQLILLLIETRSSLTEQFNSARRKKRLWEKVSDTMKETSGVAPGGDKCDEKWRNLVTSYRRIKDKLGDSGGENVTWEYFQILDRILQNKPCSAPPPNRLRASLIPVEPSLDPETSPSSEGDSLSPTADVPRTADVAHRTPSPGTSCNTPTPSASSTDSESGKRKNAPAWFQNYLKQREEERKEDQERHQASQEEKRKRWEEQKQLDKEKINSFNGLNDILARFLASQMQQNNQEN